MSDTTKPETTPRPKWATRLVVTLTVSAIVVAVASKSPFAFDGGAILTAVAGGLLAALLGALYTIAKVADRLQSVETTLGTIRDFEENGSASVVRGVIVKLELSAQRLRRGAVLVLAAILVVMGVGFYIFAAAETLSTSPDRRIERELERTSSALAEALELVRLPESTIDSSTRAAVDTLLGSAILEHKSAVASAQNFFQSRAGDLAKANLVSTATTRISTALLLLFLVQILLSLYRYNIRMASYYDGRARVLRLIIAKASNHIDDWALRDLAQVFGGDSVDFGRAPPTPLQSLSEVAEKAAGVLRK